MLENLPDLFATLAVGAALLACIHTMAWVLCTSTRDRYLGELKERLNRLMPDDRRLAVVGAILFFLLYAGSILVQDLTDHLVDSEYRAEVPVLGWGRKLLGSEKAHRVAALMPREGRQRQLNGLGKEILRNARVMKLVRRQLIDSGEDKVEVARLVAAVQGDLKIPVGSERDKRAQRAAMIIYYRAKNWLSGHPVYSTELRGLQRRIDFTRSLCLTAFVSLFVLVLVLLSNAGCLALAYVFPAWGQNTDAMQRFRTRLHRAWRPMLLLSLLMVLAALAYSRAENNFNERTFGYFSSYLHSLTAGQSLVGSR